MDRAVLGGLLIGTRAYFLHQLEGVSDERLVKVPEAIGHSILWNLGHIVYSQYSMVYKPCGLAIPLPDTYEAMFKGGTSPKNWVSTPKISDVMDHMRDSSKIVARELSKGTFDGFTQLDLAGTKLTSIEQVLGFHLYHEGIHLGMCMELKKLV